MKDERIKPIVLKDEETGDEYKLYFTRKVAEQMEEDGFDVSEVPEKPFKCVPKLFYYSFLAENDVTIEQTDAFIEKMGGIPENVVERLCQLYTETYLSLIRSQEEARKNGRMTFSL